MKTIPFTFRRNFSTPVLCLALFGLLVSACAQAPTPTPALPPTKAPASAAPQVPTAAPTQAAAKPTIAPTQPAAAKPTESAAKAAAPKELQKVRISIAGTISQAPLFIAMEKGWMKEGGIDVEIATLASGADVMGVLASGQLEVVEGAINVGTFNAVQRGVPLAVVCSPAYLTPEGDGNVLLIRPDLAGQIKSVADLKGKKVAINSPTSMLVYALGKMLEKNGLNLSDVDTPVMGFPDMITALSNKAIDAALEVEPFAARAKDQGTANELTVVSQVIGPVEIGSVFFNTDWAKKNRDIAINYTDAWLRGAREYYQALHRGPNRAEVVGILTKYSSVKDPALYEKMHWTGLNPDGYPDMASIQDQIDWYFAHGLMNQKISADQVVDNTYLDAAVQREGKYKR